jgi:predicted oxidoreductase
MAARTLAQCQQCERAAMQSSPVAVVRCNCAKAFRLLYNAGVERGQGSPEQRKQAMAFIQSLETFNDELCASQLRLSSCHKYTNFLSRGHDDNLRRPEVYVEQMDWIMARRRR